MRLLTVADLALGSRGSQRENETAQYPASAPKSCAARIPDAARGAARDAGRAIVEQVWKTEFSTRLDKCRGRVTSINLRRKVDAGYDHALIRTVRGVGYQIGGMATAV